MKNNYEENKKELVKLFNRLSYYICYSSKKDNIEITDTLTVKELHKKLTEFYKFNNK